MLRGKVKQKRPIIQKKIVIGTDPIVRIDSKDSNIGYLADGRRVRLDSSTGRPFKELLKK